MQNRVNFVMFRIRKHVYLSENINRYETDHFTGKANDNIKVPDSLLVYRSVMKKT